jgi:hypothetical protein
MTPIETFKANLDEVDRLVNFDRDILQITTSAVQTLHEQLKQRIGDERMNGGRLLQLISGIRDNDSVRARYQAIYNQAVVLLVSHFASALGDVFREAVSTRLESPDPGKLLEEEFKLTITDIKERDWTLKGAIPDLLIAKYDFTFQDMGATARAFQNYTDLRAPRGECMNNIIAAQACRHVIVHAGGRVGERTVRQVSKAVPRALRPTLIIGSQITLTLDELEVIKVNMLQFIEELTSSAEKPEISG